MRASRWLALAALMHVMLCARQVPAGAAEVAAAVALYDEAEKLMTDGNYLRACAKYAESHRLDPQLGALLHLADCYEKADLLASAWASWRDAVELAEKRGDPRKDVASESAAALEPKLAKLIVRVPASSELIDIEVRQDGRPLGRALWGSAIPVDIGAHEIEARAPGMQTWRGWVRVKKNGVIETLTVPKLQRDPNATAAAGPRSNGSAGAAPNNDASRRESKSVQSSLGWASAGLGVIGIGLGFYFDAQRRGKVEDRDAICPTGKNCADGDQARINGLTDDARNAATAETVSFVAGGLFALGGVVLLATSPSTQKAARSHFSAAPLVSRSSVGAAAAVRF